MEKREVSWQEVLDWLGANAPGVGQPVPCECGGWRWQESPVCPRCTRVAAIASQREGDRLLVASNWLSPAGRHR